MALSVERFYTGPVWPLGVVTVANNGTKVNIMTNVDANNVNNPNTVTSNNTALQTEYTRACRAITFQGYHANNNNDGLIVNTGNVYILVAPAGSGNGNRIDSGAMIKVLPAGADFTLSAITPGVDMFSPYQVWLDCDTDGDGALVTLYGGGNP